ncbi:hypothetical protein U27_07044 [Candidatus Vecturithrix granuli]|uniref:Regulator of microtubule dynamics protein 1 n=1 Tax=Vecturithrix granuli TaxID=1499967 RepID=A0A081C651_VECG1|nr:hypothetical protein U27_07044 [Candidatus Vecturithrix granuli]
MKKWISRRLWFAAYFCSVMLLGLLICSVQLVAQDVQTLLQQGDAYYEQLDNAKALVEYEKAYQLAPDDFGVLMRLTRSCNNVGEDIDSDDSKPYFERAVEYAETMLEKYPDKAETHYFLSVSYGNLAMFTGGKTKVKLSRNVKEHAEKAIRLDPNHAESHVVLGIYYREIANLNRVLKAFAKVFFGGLPGGSNEDAERSFLKALELKPDYINAHFQLAKTYEKMKDKDKAIAQYEQVLELPIHDHQDQAIKTKAEKQLSEIKK